jgi:hypothetical protein
MYLSNTLFSLVAAVKPLCAQHGIAMATADAECSLYTKRKSTFALPYNRSDEGEKPAWLDQRR